MSSRWIHRIGVARVAIVLLALGVAVATLWPRRAARPAPPLRIAAAADLRFALDELTVAFQRAQGGPAPEVVTGSSGTLYAQIVNGAPFDVFMSADVAYPRQLLAQGRGVSGTEFLYGVGRLVVWVPNESPLDVAGAGLAVVADPRVTHVAIANPQHAPYGRAAEAAMKAAGVAEAARPKLVLGDSVAQAMQFVQSGAAEVGVVALSLAIAPPARTAGRYALVPDGLYPVLEQGGVILSGGHVDAARAFRAFLSTEPSRDVLRRFGFEAPAASAPTGGGA